MIQRIQSIYILIVILAVVGLIFIAGGLIVDSPWFVPAVQSVAGIQILLALWAIFSYGNRNKQTQIITWNMWFILLFESLVVGGMVQLNTFTTLIAGEISQANWALVIIPVLSLLLFILARAKVKADIKLIKSMDRLR